MADKPRKDSDHECRDSNSAQEEARPVIILEGANLPLAKVLQRIHALATAPSQHGEVARALLRLLLALDVEDLEGIRALAKELDAELRCLIEAIDIPESEDMQEFEAEDGLDEIPFMNIPHGDA